MGASSMEASSFAGPIFVRRRRRRSAEGVGAAATASFPVAMRKGASIVLYSLQSSGTSPLHGAHLLLRHRWAGGGGVRSKLSDRRKSCLRSSGHHP
jgi:hypothetical protein